MAFNKAICTVCFLKHKNILHNMYTRVIKTDDSLKFGAKKQKKMPRKAHVAKQKTMFDKGQAIIYMREQ